MTFRPRNAAELAETLEKSGISTSNETSRETPASSPAPSTPAERQTDTKYGHHVASHERAAAYNLSSSGLLTNLTATCHQTNVKLDMLSDQISRLSCVLETVVTNQERQLEVLAAISRHTLGNTETSRNESTTIRSGSHAPKQAVLKDFGYPSTTELVSDMVARLIGIVEVQVSARGRRYRSSRDLTQSILQAAVSTACKATFRVKGAVLEPLVVPTAKSASALTVARRIGTTNGVRPALNALAFKQIMDDPDCRTMTTLLGDVVFRLCILRQMLPYYEGDILASLEFPYMDRDAEISCSWSLLRDRQETAEERAIIEAPVAKRKRIGELLAGGSSTRSAMNAVLTM